MTSTAPVAYTAHNSTRESSGRVRIITDDSISGTHDGEGSVSAEPIEKQQVAERSSQMPPGREPPASRRSSSNTVSNITLGLPIEEKEKGPNKGDILNGAVAWTRSLMWALYHKYVQEQELANHITQLGGQWPFQISEDGKRMRTELMDAVEKNDPGSFSYTRHDGSGLRVSKHTTISGERIQHNDGNSLSPLSNLELSPGFHSGGSGTNNGSDAAQTLVSRFRHVDDD
ncbi:hypothetical protein H2198_009512 [Neophaeococcomyces mojaviensis]|uniref:Uncharacterized protein n=1 Tax=Neophaeococcomyces mojaviensis TaxID=3383035 RepID=A0ACC2ZUC4_9EURO|nr:hypothetical protein H2198_009512 [Knufia sp. JES_112]